MQDLELSGKLANVYICELSCEDPIEKLYYTAKYPPICVYCAHTMSEADSEIDDEHFSQCEGCSDKYQSREVVYYNYCVCTFLYVLCVLILECTLEHYSCFYC